MNPRVLQVLALATTLVLGVSAFYGCARSERTERPVVCEPGTPAVVDPVLMAFLSKARSAHHKADAAEQTGDLPGAIASLELLTRGSVPGGDKPLSEAAEVLADTHARLADLRSTRGDFDQALENVSLGLGFASDVTYFRGHLFEVRGLVEERRAKVLDDRGEADRAKQARKAAIDSFDEAVRIQEQVIVHALGDAGLRP